MTVQNASAINYDTLNATCETLFQTLDQHGVFRGDEGKWLEMQKRSFTRMVQNHVTSGDRYLEITYSPTQVRLLVSTKVEGGTATVTEIDAYDHPRRNPKMDYDALNRDLHAVLS